MVLGRVILRLEKARRELLSVDPGNKEKLLAASQKVDKLVVEYFRAKRTGRL
ncbi:aspartyl-phosphate phosphatase Spo0E family protein [Desulfallas sp. Bu1-1]|uniref:aspartyl-phosphate phosphatase Spo0E family protein n=1 Tax=Desulfallas sp. Bu1-1 TaxID=2787620 RepID=UPI0028BD4F3B|nr:aspartyl-phosphate phosphatase Spo0E family protein [Desulfallas sp. Bu1-1]